MIAFIEYVIQPINELKTGVEGSFNLYIDRPEKFGGPIQYDSVETLKNDFVEGKLAPPDLKLGVADKINELLAPIRAEFETNEEFQEAEKKGYPVEKPKEKKKKVKKIGTRYPGAVAKEETKEEK